MLSHHTFQEADERSEYHADPLLAYKAITYPDTLHHRQAIKQI